MHCNINERKTRKLYFCYDGFFPWKLNSGSCGKIFEFQVPPAWMSQYNHISQYDHTEDNAHHQFVIRMNICHFIDMTHSEVYPLIVTMNYLISSSLLAIPSYIHKCILYLYYTGAALKTILLLYHLIAKKNHPLLTHYLWEIWFRQSLPLCEESVSSYYHL